MAGLSAEQEAMQEARRNRRVGACPGRVCSDTSNPSPGTQSAVIVPERQRSCVVIALFSPRNEGPPNGVIQMNIKTHETSSASTPGHDVKHETAPVLPGRGDKLRPEQHEKPGADKHADGQKAFEKNTSPTHGN